jgi:hypothetical protein
MSYELGDNRDRHDLAIEVVVTSGGIDIAVTTAMRGGEGMGEYPHAGVSPLHPVPHPSEKRYKLKAYQRLQIPEVWFWEKDQLSLYALRTNCYEEITQSEALPKLDIALLACCCLQTDNHSQALRESRQALVES